MCIMMTDATEHPALVIVLLYDVPVTASFLLSLQR